MMKDTFFLKEISCQRKLNKEEQKLFLKKLIECDKVSDRVLSWGGKLALENQNWAFAENFFSCLLERRSQPEDLIGLAQALFKKNCLKEAEECLLEAMSCIPEPCHLLFIVYKNLGDIYLVAENFSMSEEFYNKAYTLSPHSVSLRFHKALLSLRQKHYSLAERQFQDILTSEPQHASAWMGLSIARKFLNEDELAKACLYRCLDLNPNYTRAQHLKEMWSSQLAPTTSHQFKFSF